MKEQIKKALWERVKSAYPYPYNFERCSTDNRYYDIGWSDKKMKIDIRVTEL